MQTDNLKCFQDFLTLAFRGTLFVNLTYHTIISLWQLMAIKLPAMLFIADFMLDIKIDSYCCIWLHIFIK